MKRAALPPAEPVPVAIVLSVRLTDGSFESNTTIPVTASSEEKQAATMKWLEIMQFGLKLSGDVKIDTATDLVVTP